MPNNNRENFLKAVVEWTERGATDKLLDVAREAIQAMNAEIVQNTPVDTGFLRSSYFASLNEIPSGPAGAGTVAINVPLTELKVGDVYYLGNTAVYARRVEMGFVGTDSLGRYYNQVGRFWIANVVDRWKVFLEDAVTKVQENG